jgi:hypothetical protein
MISFLEILWLHIFFSLLWLTIYSVITVPKQFCRVIYQYLLIVGLRWVALRAEEHFLPDKHARARVSVRVFVFIFPPNIAANGVV